MTARNRHLIVISADAMVDADLEYAFSLPNFKRLMERGSQVRHVESIYPSVTYPAHCTMATGCYPEKTGVYTNDFFRPGELHPDWQWFHDVVKVPDIFDAAHGAGLTTAAVFWPVTGLHPSIDYLIDEYWPQGEYDDKYDAMSRSGSNAELMRKVVRPYLKDVTIRKHPETDVFIARAAAEIIRLYKPNLLMIHPADIDSARHHNGQFGPAIDRAVHDTDTYLGWLMDAAEEAGIYEDCDFVVMSDHGQIGINRVMNLNVKLKEAGYIDVDGEGNLTGWRAYIQSVGMSAHVHVKDPKDEAEVYAFLKALLEEEVYGISEILTKDEAKERFHLSGDFSFVLETDGFTSFGDDWHRPLMRSYDNTDYRHGRATHGYMPFKGPQAIFLCAGPHVRPGVAIEKGSLVDAAPTMAAMLGIELPDAQGKPWSDIVRR